MSAQANPLPEALCQPGAYPHSVDHVSVRETHISWVFLTGKFAYKVKKPVVTPFLDFSTLERRLSACQEELRLNRRFADDLYLEVLPITGTTANPLVGGEGVPLEFAVKMQQFPEAAVLARMAKQGQLTTGLIDELAHIVAGFHRDASRLDLHDQWGTPEEIIAAAFDNLDQLDQVEATELERALRPIRSWTETAAARLRPVFQRRLAAGFVRECHGDLHLGNILIWNAEDPSAAPERGRVTPFDGIEFNPEFRWIDVISDIAFAAMDLSDRGRPDLSARLINAWLEESGDYGGLAVLDWYLVYRALVRAKVDVLRAHQEREHPSICQSQLDDALQYVRLAESLTTRRTARLAITCGLSGSGKTTGTQRLIDDAGMIRIRSDVERKRLAGLTSDARSRSPVADGLYAPDWTERTYRRLIELAREVVLSRRSVIVDATFLRREDRRRFRTLANDLGVEFVVIPFATDESKLRDRIRARALAGGDASEAGLAVLEYQLQHHDSLAGDELSVCRSAAELLSDDVRTS